MPTPEETPPSWVPFFDGYDSSEPSRASDSAEPHRQVHTAPEGDDDLHEVLITHAYPIAWLIRHALDAPAVRWLGLSSANAALTVIEYRPSVPPSIVIFNDMSHLRATCNGPASRDTAPLKAPRPR